MSKKVLVAVSLLVVLVAVYLLTRASHQTTAEPAAWSVPPTESIDTLEVSDGRLTLVFRREADGWEQTEPVRAPASAAAFAEVEALFAAGLEADLTSSAGASFEDYGLLGEGVMHIRAYASDTKIADFAVGKEVTVPNTHARRTWLQPDGATVAFRAYSTAENIELGRVLGRGLDDWRERQIIGMTREQIEAFTIERDGAVVRAQRAQRAGTEGSAKPQYDWKVIEPAGIASDTARLSAIVNTLGTFKVEGFADGVSAAAAGLESPMGRMTVTGDGREVVLEIGAEVAASADAEPAAGPKNRYVRLAGKPYIYIAAGRQAADVLARLGELRDKSVLTFNRDDVQALAFAGEPSFSLGRQDTVWKLSAPLLEGTVEDAKMRSLLGTLANLRALEYPELMGTQAAGFDDPTARTITITLGDGTQHIVRLGAPVAAEQAENGNVYAQVDDGLVFILAAYSAQQLTVEPEALVLTALPAAGELPAPVTP